MAETWIQTYTGRAFAPLSPRVADVDLVDIAHSLSLLSRFNGHCRVFYSVAEHSVRVSHAVPAQDALWGLMHDAAEAYLSDLPRPVKRECAWFREVEDGLLRVIAQAFALPWPPPGSVREADDRLLATEARDLMGPAPQPWRLTAEPYPEPIVPLGPDVAEQAFLSRFAELRPA